MTADLRTAYLQDMVRMYRNYRTLAERAVAQISDDDLHTLVDPDANSIAIIVRHVGGNLRSRFTDFLTTDGEKPDRHGDRSASQKVSRPPPASATSRRRASPARGRHVSPWRGLRRARRS